MESNTFNYEQAILGLVLLGARADGVFQEDEKQLIIELTSEVHVLSPLDYRFVIEQAKARDYDRLTQQVYNALLVCTKDQRMEALYWLLKLIKVDTADDVDGYLGEMNTYREALDKLQIKEHEMQAYEKERDKQLR
ncbi:hypothetical protein [Eisenibacter elegans]|uniref:hypothetical protein n=1 Tax=Eisenibacter elegans TaxID=997 RepID=UPI00047A7FED|nr:hypothetical protein [Eisenibacter elegans]